MPRNRRKAKHKGSGSAPESMQLLEQSRIADYTPASEDELKAPWRQISRFFQVFVPGEEPQLDVPPVGSKEFDLEVQAAMA